MSILLTILFIDNMASGLYLFYKAGKVSENNRHEAIASIIVGLFRIALALLILKNYLL